MSINALRVLVARTNFDELNTVFYLKSLERCGLEKQVSVFNNIWISEIFCIFRLLNLTKLLNIFRE